MKKIVILSALGLFFTACDDSDSCHCEVFENLGTETQPEWRYIGSLDGTCDDVIKEEGKLYDTVNCE